MKPPNGVTGNTLETVLPVTPLSRDLAEVITQADHSVMSDWKSLGQKYRQARNEKGLNQTQMAQLAGIAQTTLSDVENGRTTTTKTLSALADASGLELRVEAYPVGESPPPLPPEMRALARVFGNLSPDEQRAFIELMEIWPHLPDDLRNGTLRNWSYWRQMHAPDTTHSTV